MPCRIDGVKVKGERKIHCDQKAESIVYDFVCQSKGFKRALKIRIVGLRYEYTNREQADPHNSVLVLQIIRDFFSFFFFSRVY